MLTTSVAECEVETRPLGCGGTVCLGYVYGWALKGKVRAGAGGNGRVGGSIKKSGDIGAFRISAAHRIKPVSFSSGSSVDSCPCPV